MTTYSTGRRLAIAAGAAASTGALAILLSDPIRASLAGNHGLWTVKHLLTVLVVGITICIGHLATAAAKEWRFLAATGFAVMFVLGSILTVYWSVGRQTEASVTRTIEIEQVNQRHARVSKLLGEAEAMLATARAKHSVECASGAGAKCTGIQKTIDVYEAAIKGHRGELSRLVVRPANAEAETVAEVTAMLTGAGKDKVKAVLVLLEPFAPALFFEIVAIVAFGYGFGRRKRVQANDNAALDTDIKPVSAEPDTMDTPAGPRPKRKRKAKNRQEKVVQFVRQYTQEHGHPPSFKVVKGRFHLPKATASRLRRAAINDAA